VIHLVDHGGHDARGIRFNVDHFVPKVFRVNPFDGLADVRTDHFVAFVHGSLLPSLDGYIIHEDPEKWNVKNGKNFSQIINCTLKWIMYN